MANGGRWRNINTSGKTDRKTTTNILIKIFFADVVSAMSIKCRGRLEVISGQLLPGKPDLKHEKASLRELEPVQLQGRVQRGNEESQREMRKVSAADTRF